MLVAACRRPAATTSTAVRVAVPDRHDVGDLCTDMGLARVCWKGNQAAIVPREVPSGAAVPHGYRCGGTGRDRTCEDRLHNAGAFVCGKQRCLQARPRMPDDGEWECVEMQGVVVCHSRGPVAGMQAGPMDLGWLCGPRAGTSDGQRVCVDFDADRPDAAAPAPARCRFQASFGTAQRSCTPAREPLVGSACGAQGACPLGSGCVQGLCVPDRPAPACWFDRDCGPGAHCRFGSCRHEGT